MMRSPSACIRCLGAALLAVWVSLAWAAPTDLDARWDRDGLLLLGGLAQTKLYGFLLQADGSLIAALGAGDDALRIVRFDSAGQPDLAFGSAGRIHAPREGQAPVSMALRADGRFDALWHRQYVATPSTRECYRTWARYLPSGQPDTRFGAEGRIDLSGGCGTDLQLDSRGTSYRIEATSNPVFGTYHASIVAYDEDGRLLTSYAPFDTTRWYVGQLRVDRRDRVLVSLGPSGGPDATLAVGRILGGPFGEDGVAVVAVPRTTRLRGVLPLADGGVVTYAAMDGAATEPAQGIVVRLTEDGQLDTSFGQGGVVVIPLASAGDYGVYYLTAIEMSDGRLVVAADVGGPLDAQQGYSRLVLARLHPDGRPDATFAGAGVGDIRTGESTFLQASLALRPDGALMLGVWIYGTAMDRLPQSALLQFVGGDLQTAHDVRERRAVEYFHSSLGHYFVTADLREVARLDSMPALGWQATGLSFNVWDMASSLLTPVCRFWSDQSFAPKSSHFYSPYAHECELLKQGTVWRHEGDVFHLRLPEGPPESRRCPPDTQALYRAYNNGLSGAPNHRYTIEPALLDQMIAQGWTMEGQGDARVFACVPLQE